jgi:DNA-binding MarR family transcriptional regulator
MITLNFTELTILYKVYEGYRCQDIADFLGIEKSLISRRADKLIKLGLIVRVENTGIRHSAYRYELTPAGRDFLISMRIEYKTVSLTN